MLFRCIVKSNISTPFRQRRPRKKISKCFKSDQTICYTNPYFYLMSDNRILQAVEFGGVHSLAFKEQP